MFRVSWALLFIAVVTCGVAISPLNASKLSMPQPVSAFTPNAGQILDNEGNSRPDVLYRSIGGSSEMYLRTSGFSYVFTAFDAADQSAPDLSAAQPVTRYRMDMELLGANLNSETVGRESIAGHENHYRGRNQAIVELQSYREVIYREIYPNIDLRVFYSGSGLKYDFLVWPGGSPADIRMQYVGATDIRLRANGSMIVKNPYGEVREDRPFSYQAAALDPAQRDPALPAADQQSLQEVESGFRIRQGVIDFEVADYDPKRLLVIDPGLAWASYYGGDGLDYFVDVATEADGSVVLTGASGSSDFPTTPGIGIQADLAGSRDGMVVKFNAARERVWATYFGGNSVDEVIGMHVNDGGNINIVGGTLSSNLPIANAFQSQLSTNIGGDAFVSQFDGELGQIRWSTYFGGSGFEQMTGITGNGEMLVICGFVRGDAVGFPLLNAHKTVKNAKDDIFLTRFSHDGQPVWSTFFGGAEDDIAVGVTINDEGSIGLAGWTLSNDIAGTAGSYQPDKSGGQDALVAQFDAATGQSVWVTYLGTNSNDLAYDIISLPGSNHFVIVGATYSSSFPVINGFQATPKNDPAGTNLCDMFFFEFDKSGRAHWSTYHGGESLDFGVELSAFRDGSFAFAGVTLSNEISTTPDAFVPTREHNLWGINIGVISASRDLVYSTYLPHDSHSYIVGLAVTGQSVADGSLIVAGVSTLSDLPTTENAFQNVMSGSSSGYVIEFGCSTFTEITADSPLEVCEGRRVTLDAGAGFADYIWSTGERTRQIEVDASGEFYVKVVDPNGCEFTTPPTEITVFPNPELNITADGPLQSCEGGSVTLDAGAGYEKYAWSNGAETQTISVSGTDEYSVIVTGGGGCTAEASVQVDLREPWEVTAAPAALDWGILDGCQSSVSLPLTLTNTSDYAVFVERLEFSNTAVFAAANFLANTEIAAGADVTLDIVFTPATLDPVNAELRIHISPCDDVIIIPLTGSKGELLLTATPSTIDFGDVLLCENATAEQAVEFENSGAEDVVLQSAQVNGPFALAAPSQLPLTLPPGAKEPLLIRFTPTAAGAASSAISINYSSGSCNDKIQIVVSGTGRDAAVELVNDQVLQFASLSDCELSADAELLLRPSDGAEGPLRIIAIDDVSGQLGAQAPLPLELPLKLPLADPLSLPLRLTPGATGLISGSARITYELDGCTGTLEFEYGGEKVGISIDVPPLVDFGDYFSCEQTSLTRRVAITRSGAELTIGTVTVDGNFDVNLVEDVAAPEFFDITFTTDAAEAAGSITIVFMPCNIERVITLTGRRIDLSMRGAATEDFGPVQLGDMATRTVSWTNEGNGPIEISAIECLAAPFSILAPTTFPLDVAPGESLEVVVQFSATSVGSFTGEFCVRSTSPCDLTYRTSLTGVGTEEEVQVPEVDIYIPDLVANPHWPSFEIPILVRSLQDFDGDFEVEALVYMRMNSSVFLPQSLQNGAIESNLRTPDERTLVLRSGAVTLTEDGPLAVLSGVPLLGNTVTSALRLDSVVFINREVDATLNDGSLTLDSLCEAGGTRLLTRVPSFGILGLSPNPSSRPPVFRVRGYAGASLQMLIRSTTGRTVFEREWAKPGSNIITVVPELALAPGVYQLVLRAQSAVDERLFVIVR